MGLSNSHGTGLRMGRARRFQFAGEALSLAERATVAA